MHTSPRVPVKLITLFAIGLVLAGGVLLLTPSPAPAKPSINWTPESLTQTILAGESQTVPVSFTASEQLNNVVVRVVPELGHYVSTNPTSFASLAKGQTVTLDVIVAAPADALPKVVDGVIQLRSGQGAPKTFAKPLPIVVAINEGLAGIDADQDGVRDDVEQYIAETYPDSAKTRAALMQYARNIQEALLMAEDKEASVELGLKRSGAIECLVYVRDPEEAIVIFGELRARILNTDERSSAYIKANNHLSGVDFPRVSEGERRAFCDFNPDVMEN
jgi:hypothetical protein